MKALGLKLKRNEKHEREVPISEGAFEGAGGGAVERNAADGAYDEVTVVEYGGLDHGAG